MTQWSFYIYTGDQDRPRRGQFCRRRLWALAWEGTQADPVHISTWVRDPTLARPELYCMAFRTLFKH